MDPGPSQGPLPLLELFHQSSPYSGDNPLASLFHHPLWDTPYLGLFSVFLWRGSAPHG